MSGSGQVAPEGAGDVPLTSQPGSGGDYGAAEQGQAGKAPPSFQEATSTRGPPPSYESLFGKVKEVRENSAGNAEFAQGMFKVFVTSLAGTICCGIMLGFSLVLPIWMICAGALYPDCPAQPLLPTWLIVSGSFGIIKSLMDIYTQVKRHQSHGERVSGPEGGCVGLINLFQLCWFITGCVWVYQIYEPSYTAGDANYCNYTVFMTAFVMVNIGIACVVLGLLFCCCGVASCCIFASKAK